MPTQLEQELGIAPTTHRFRRWVRNLFGRLRGGFVEPYQRTLDPLTVNYAAWREVRRNIREWPSYLEAPNSIEVLVSPEDWEDYWGIDAARKEAGISTYVRVQAAKKGYWISGDPQVIVTEDDSVQMGDVDVVCQFVEPEDQLEPMPVSGTAPIDVSQAQITTRLHRAGNAEEGPVVAPGATSPRSAPNASAPFVTPVAPHAPAAVPVFPTSSGSGAPDAQPADDVPPTVRFVDPEEAGEACLVGEGSFRLVVRSGDCIGAVSPGESVPEEVNVRLDAEAFPYVATKQCTLGVLDGRWTVTNHAARGTKLLTAEGTRLMLGEPEPYPINEGDVLYLGTDRPLRFELL